MPVDGSSREGVSHPISILTSMPASPIQIHTVEKSAKGPTVICRYSGMNNQPHPLQPLATKLGLTVDRLIELAQGSEPATPAERSVAPGLTDGFAVAQNNSATFASLLENK